MVEKDEKFDQKEVEMTIEEKVLRLKESWNDGLFKELYKDVEGIALRLVNSFQVDAVDLIPTALYRAIQNYSPKKHVKFTTLFFSIFRNDCIDCIYKEQRRVKILEGYKRKLSEPSHKRDFDEMLMIKDFLGVLLKRLPKEYRKILLMLRKRYTFSEIAKTLNVSPTTITFRMKDVKKVAEEIKKEMHFVYLP